MASAIVYPGSSNSYVEGLINAVVQDYEVLCEAFGLEPLPY